MTAVAHEPADFPAAEEFCRYFIAQAECYEWHPEWVQLQISLTYQAPHRVYRGMGNGTTDVERWIPLIAKYFPSDSVATMTCLVKHESGGNPDAKNPTSSARGLTQILASIWSPAFGVSYDDLYDPETNIRLARQIYDIQGYHAWSPYVRGLCRGL